MVRQLHVYFMKRWRWERSFNECIAAERLLHWLSGDSNSIVIFFRAGHVLTKCHKKWWLTPVWSLMMLFNDVEHETLFQVWFQYLTENLWALDELTTYWVVSVSSSHQSICPYLYGDILCTMTQTLLFALKFSSGWRVVNHTKEKNQV